MEPMLKQEMEVDVVLPAGGRIEGELAAESNTEIKALISFGGQTILERTISVLRETGEIGRIVVIGPKELNDHPSTLCADVLLPEGESGPDNIFRGLDWLREQNSQKQQERSRRVLILTTDLPFLTPSAINGFLEACPAEADICVPIIERKEFEMTFPDAPNFYVRLGDGEWTLGCAFLLDPVALRNNRREIERVFTARKSQIQMARLLGTLFILRFLTRRLTVGHITQRCESVLGCKGAVVLKCAPELAFDIDLLSEYRYALEWAPPVPDSG